LSLAIASLAVIASLWATKEPPKKSPPVTAAARENQVQTHMGTRTNLLLPDGTVVWLNAGSVLTYPASFSGEKREVTLEGEAFFDVAANATHPFIVHTSTANIRVLGTSFDVKAYERDKTMETTLIKGSIEVTYRKSRIVLKPNQKLVVAKMIDSVAAEERPKDTAPEVRLLKPTIEVHTGAIIETSWTDNKLIFQDEDFKALAEQMERWYGVTIDFDRRELENLRFTGTFQKETIRQALEALQLTASFKYSITGNQITIYER
jgi:ferric-dicitrate binding protein FerR (iron transport regulator)